MESWRLVWRTGFVPALAELVPDVVVRKVALCELLRAVREDDQKLSQGSTTTPPPLMCVQDWPVEAADCLGFLGAALNGGFHKLADGKDNPTACSVGTAEEFFARMCYEADQRLGEPAACRWFLNWFDETPRHEMRENLAAELHIMIAMLDAAEANAPNVPRPEDFPTRVQLPPLGPFLPATPF